VINPNGVLIGPNARIEAASFIASTLDVLNAEFLNTSSQLFSGKSQSSVINLGSIECPAGTIALFARSVRNSGSLSAKSVAMGAGSEILLKVGGDFNLISLPIDSKPDESDEVSLVNEGQVHALMAELKSSENPYSVAIQQKGLIDVNFDNEVGTAEIIAQNGVLEMSGTIQAVSETSSGGSVHLLGEKVALLDSASIDVSGYSGGGTVLVGGDFQGKNPEIKNASYVWAGPSTKVAADALYSGDGGKVIFWSDDAMLAYGKISIRGGPILGNGGFAEVSGKNLDYRGFTDGSAPFGKNGKLLLDPNDIVIGAVATTGSFTACPNSTYTITTGTATNQILNTDLNTQLASCDVTVSTVGSAGTGPNDGSITVSSALSWAAQTTLTLDAAAFVLVSASITNTAAAGAFDAIVLQSHGSAAGSYDGVTIQTPAALTCTNGNIVIEGVAAQSGNGAGAFINAASLISSAGAITFQNCLGGTTGASNVGANFFSTFAVAAPTITVTNCQGGTGSGARGFLISGAGTFGILTSNVPPISDSTISITATGGTGSQCEGILISSGTLQTGGSGSITLNGTGGTALAAGAGANAGIEIAGGTLLAGTGTSSTATVTMTGVGGGGATTAGDNHGVIITSGATITHNGNGAFRFLNCTGGSGNGVVNNIGVSIDTSIIPTGSSSSLLFTNCTGGTGGAGNYGVYIGPSGNIQATTITATSTGGAGTDTNYGFYIDQGIVGSAANATSISITATGAGTGSNNHGFYMANGTVQSAGAGTIAINGTGSSAGTDSNHGLVLTSSSAVIRSVNGNITLTGTAGAGAASKEIIILTTNPTVNTTGSGGITFASPLTFAAVSSLISASGTGNLTFSDTVDGAFALTFAAGGTMTFNGVVGGTAPPTGFTTTAAAFSLGANITTANGAQIAMANPITLTAPVTLTNTGAAINLGSTINGAYVLTTSSDGTTTLGGDVGLSTRLTGLSVTSGAITIGASNINTSGAILMAATTTATTTGTLTISQTGSGGVSFTSGNATTLTVADHFTINATNTTVSFSGALVATGPSAGVDGSNVTINAGGDITMGGAISATGGAESGGIGPNGGNVNLDSTGGSISVQSVDVSGTNGTNDGGSAGSITIEPALTCVEGALGCIPDGRIILNGNLTAARGTGALSNGIDGPILLVATGRSTIPSIATIVSSYAGNDVVLTGSNIVTGSTETISILGSFTATASTSIILSNLVVKDSITLQGPVGVTPILVLLAHGDQTVLEYTGSLGVISTEHIISPSITNNTTVVGNSSYIATTTLTPSELATRMTYTPDSYLLDYSIGITPASTGTSSVSCNCNPSIKLTFGEFSMLNVIADAQLTDILNRLNADILKKKFYLENRCANGEATSGRIVSDKTHLCE